MVIPGGEKAKINKILVTGGCGRIGSYFVKFASGRYTIRVVDKVAWNRDKLGEFNGETLVADLQDLERCREACQGMDAVIHLAADPSLEAKFDSLLPNNIITPYNMFTAAKEAGCKRFLFASSVHAVEGYPEDVIVNPQMPVRPKNLYGATKCFGEAMGIYFAYTEGLPTIALRIGVYRPAGSKLPIRYDDKKAYINPDDFNQLLVKCLETPGIQFAIVHAASDNRFKRLDITETIREFGYEPKADAFEIL